MTEFTSDRTSSNKAGVTLMNNQVGYVVANVMRDKENIVITELPSMIRVDGVNKIDFDYEENEGNPLKYRKFDLTEQGPAIGVAISL